MTQTQPISQDIRRHADGSIDLDFYRANAVALRRQAMRDASVLRTTGTGVLTLAGILALSLLAASPLSIPGGPMTVAQANASQPR